MVYLHVEELIVKMLLVIDTMLCAKLYFEECLSFFMFAYPTRGS